MSDTPTPLTPEAAVELPAPPPEPPARRNLLPWLTAAGFLILAIGLVLVWRHPSVQTARLDALAEGLGALETRITRLEERPVPQPPDLRPLTARVTALEQRPAASQPGPPAQPADLAPLAARVAALEQRQSPSLAPLEARIAELEHRPVPSLAPLEARIASLESADRAAQAELSKRLAGSEKSAAHTARVQAASFALAAGQKLGDVQGAPPALARFAAAPPPTEAALRAAFAPAARAALDAAHPVAEGQPLMTRLWAQAQELVTIRQGDQVLVGDPTAGVLERARVAVEAGDLAAAVTALASLQGGAAAAMAGWLEQARALLEARAALATWAAAG
jgi:hypothetical protein